MEIFAIAGILAVVGAVILLLMLLTSFALRRVVPTNMVHIVQAKKSTRPYGRGKEAGNVYYAWPAFLPFVGVEVTKMPESNFDVSLDQYNAYDKGRVPFVVDIKAFFKISDPELAAQRVANFDELLLQLADVLKGSVRRILATNNLEEIMQDRAKLGTEFTEEVTEGLAKWGVEPVKMIEFMDIRDAQGSTVIANIMAKEVSRIDRESRVQVAENNQQAEQKEIDAKRAIEVQRQDAEQQVGIRTAEKDRVVGLADEVTRQEILAQAKVTTERDMDVKKVQEVRAADIAKEVAVVRANQEKEVQIVNANAAKEQTIISANAKKAETETIASGNLTEAELSAKGTLATGAAEAEARKLMEMAPVAAQVTLAQEIGENEGYQKYLTDIRQIEANQAVGTEAAKALSQADLKVIANSGDVSSGVTSLLDVFSAKGGTQLGGMLEAIRNSPEGAKILSKLTGEEAPIKAGKKVQLNG